MLLPLVVFVNLNSRAAIQKKEVNSFRPPFFLRILVSSIISVFCLLAQKKALNNLSFTDIPAYTAFSN